MTAYSGLYNGVHGENYALLHTKPTAQRKVGRLMKRRSMIVTREVVDTVAAASSINGAAAVTFAQIDNTVDPGNSVVNGGARTINTVERIAAATTVTAAQETEVDAMVDFKTGPAITSYPADAGGNGGGGKLG